MSPLVVAAALSLLAAGAASAQPSASPSTVAPVTVEAPLTPREALIKSQGFVRTYAKATPTLDQFARWEDPVCVAVYGVTPEQVALIKARVEEVAKGVGLKLGRPSCRPNIDIRFADPPQVLLDKVAEKRPGLLGFHYPNELEALKKVTRPVQAWYMTASRGEGAGEVALSTMGVGYQGLTDPNGNRAETSLTATTGMPEAIRPNESLDRPGGGIPNGCAGRRFSSCLQSVFWHVLVVVDARKVQGQPLGPIMDYLAMLAISQPQSLDGCLDLPSIIDLFAPTPCPERTAPDGLTRADTAYLTSLYKADLEGKKTVEVSDMADRMADMLTQVRPPEPRAKVGAVMAVQDKADRSPAAPGAGSARAARLEAEQGCFADQKALTRGLSAQAARPGLESVVASCTAFIASHPSAGTMGLALQARAAAHLKLGDADPSVADYTAALEPVHNPRETARILQNRALAYLALGQDNLAIADFTAAVKLDPQNPRATELMIAAAMVYDRNRQVDQAIEIYSAVLNKHPREVRAFVGRGYVEAAKGDRGAAEADARRSIELNPDYAPGHKLMASLLIAEGRAKEAFADAQAAVKADPNDALALEFRADAVLAAGEREEALADYGRAIAMDPKLATAFNNRGAAYLGKGDSKAAMDDFKTAIGLDPGLASAWLNRGLARQAMGDEAGAIADFGQAIAVDPRNADAWRHRGFLEQRRGQHDQAADDYGRAIALNPMDEEALRGRGFAEISLERYAAAVADLTAALAIDPKDGTAYGFRAMAYAGTGQDALGLADNDKAKQLSRSAARQ